MTRAGSEHFASMGNRIGHDEAEKAANHLLERASYELCSPDGLSDLSLAAERLVGHYLEQPEYPGEPQSAVADPYHLFLATAANGTDALRRLVRGYDYLHPHEVPELRDKRHRNIMQRGVEAAVTRRHTASDMELAPAVSGDAFQLPPGFTLVSAQTTPVSVSFPTRGEALDAVAFYEDETAPEKPDQPLRIIAPNTPWTSGQIGEWTIMDYSTVPHVRTNDTDITGGHSTASFGIAPIERFAHVVGKPVEYANGFEIVFRCPMPKNVASLRERARVTVPKAHIAQVLGSVVGHELITGDDTFIRSYPSTGSVHFGGGFDEHNSLAVHADRFARHLPVDAAFSAPAFKTEINLPADLSEAEISLAARRVSAWAVQQIGPDARRGIFGIAKYT